MENMNVAQSLVRGSDNINKMKSEIERVVTMVSALVDNQTIEKYVNFDDQGSTNFQSPKGDWVLDWGFKGKRQGISGIGYCGLGDEKFSFFWIISQDLCNRRNIPCYLEKVQRVYEELPVFIEGMLKTFPYLAERLEPFFKASKVDI